MRMAVGFHSCCTFLDLYAAEGVNARGGCATRKDGLGGEEQKEDFFNGPQTRLPS